MEWFNKIIHSKQFQETKAECEARGNGSLQVVYGQLAVNLARRQNDKELAQMAVGYYTAALSKGSDAANNGLGCIYHYGLPGIQPDKELARQYYQASDSEVARYNLKLL